MLKLKDEVKTFENIILEVVKKNSPAFIWDIISNEVIRVPVTLRNFNSYKKTVTFEIDNRSKEYIKELISGPGLLKFYIPETQLLFVSRIEHYRGNVLEINYPEAFKKHDRRKDERIEPLIPVYFKSEGLKKECYDISNGGLSFVVNGMEYRNNKYEEGSQIECFIEFPFKKVKIIATVTNVANIKLFEVDRFPYGAKRVSLKVSEGDLFKESVQRLTNGMRKLITDLL